MIHWQGHEVLADPVVAAWTHVDPLAVSRLFLVQGVLEKKVNQTLEVSSRGAIMLWQSYLRTDWLQEVFRENPLTSHLVSNPGAHCQTGESLDIVQVDSFESTDEVSDRSVESKLNSKAVQVFGDFSLIFVAQIIALQLA